MPSNRLSELRDLMAARLPPTYEPLLLTFYGHEARDTGDSVIIGDDYGTELHVITDGTVLSVDPKGQLPMRFVNSSIELLAEFVDVVSETDRSHDERERAMWHTLAALDPPAFADEQNWWAVVLEEVRQEAGW